MDTGRAVCFVSALLLALCMSMMGLEGLTTSVRECSNYLGSTLTFFPTPVHPLKVLVAIIGMMMLFIMIMVLFFSNNTLSDKELLDEIGFTTEREKDIIINFAARSDLSVNQLFKQAMRVYQFQRDNPTPVELSKLCKEEDLPGVGPSIVD